MKHLKVTFFVLVFASSIFGFSTAKQLIPYSIAFYNLENLFDTLNTNTTYDLEYSPKGDKRWDTQKYNAKLNNMARVINMIGRDITPLGPAVIGVSEIENRSVLEDLVKCNALRASNLQIVHHDSPDRRGVDVALLYNPLLFTLTSQSAHKLHIPDVPGFLTRDVFLVSGVIDGEKFHILINHWPSRTRGERASRPLRIAAAELNRHLHDSIRIAEPNSKVIIMGDLNDDPNNASVRIALGAKAKQSDVPKNGLFNPFASIHAKGVGSLAYQGQWNLFDQIIISDNLLGSDRSRFKFWKAEIFSRDFMIAQEGRYKGYPLRTHSGNVFLNGFSDHFPTLIYLVKEFEE